MSHTVPLPMSPTAIAGGTAVALAGGSAAAVAAKTKFSAASGRLRPPPLAEWQVCFLAGIFAEFNKVSVIFPLDVIRNRMVSASPGMYKNLFDCGKQIVQAEGIRGLYRGLGGAYASYIGRGTFGLSIYGNLLDYLSPARNPEKRPFSAVALASTGAGCAMAFYECPFEIAVMQLQAQNMRAKMATQQAGVSITTGSALQLANARMRAKHEVTVRYGHGGLQCALRTMIQERKFAMGFTPLFVRNVLWWPTSFCFFEEGKAAASRYNFGSDSKAAQAQLDFKWRFVIGCVAGMGSWAAMFPVEVVRISMMGQPLADRFRQFRSPMECVRTLYDEGGVRRFFRGMSPAMLRAIPAYTIGLNCWDMAGNFLRSGR